MSFCLEKDPEKGLFDLEQELLTRFLSNSPTLPGSPKPHKVETPLSSSSPDQETSLLDYGDRLVFNYLAPRAHPRYGNKFYDLSIVLAIRFRHMNITRIQHDLLHLQQDLLYPGGGTAANFNRLSSLLHEQTTAIRDLDFIRRSTNKIDNPTYKKDVLDLYPELPWADGIPPLRLGLLKELKTKSRSLAEGVQGLIPRKWCWSKAERELRPHAYELHLGGASDSGPRRLSLPVIVFVGGITSLASSALILVPIILMSFGTNRSRSLIIAAVAVPTFGLVLGAVVRTKISETFLATATYAAILVVFLGTNGSGDM